MKTKFFQMNIEGIFSQLIKNLLYRVDIIFINIIYKFKVFIFYAFNKIYLESDFI